MGIFNTPIYKIKPNQSRDNNLGVLLVGIGFIILFLIMMIIAWVIL